MSWTLCTSGSAVLTAGANANSTIAASGSALSAWSEAAEGEIEQETNTSWVASYATLSTSIKTALSNICAAKIGMRIVSYDMSGYTDRREAETILDVLDDRINKGIRALAGKADKLKTP